MTEERIDIVITDKISDKIAAKIRDIATQAREAQSSLDLLKKQLSSLGVSSVAKINSTISNSARQLKSAAAQSARDIKAVAVASANAQIALDRTAREVEQFRAAVDPSAAAVARLNAQLAQANSLFKKGEISSEEYTRSVSVLNSRLADSARIAALQNQRGTSRQALQRRQNLFFQANDIGVGLASGQALGTVLIQQGSQILGIYGANGGLRQGLKLLYKDFAALVLPFAPLLAAIGAVAGAFSLLQNEVNKGQQLQVSFTDTVKASFQVLASYIKNEFPGAIGAANFALQAFGAGAKIILNGVVGLFRFLGGSVSLIFEGIQATVSLAMAELYNFVVGFVDDAIKAFVELRNQAAEIYNEFIGFQKFQIISPGSVANLRIGDEALGKLYKRAQDVGTAFNELARSSVETDFLKNAADAIRPQAQQNARDRLAEEAKKRGKDPKQELTEYQKLIAEINQPITEAALKIPLLNQAIAEGKIPAEAGASAIRQLQIAVLDLNRDVGSGVQSGLLRLQEEFTNLASLASKTLVDGFRSAEDALVEFVATGKLNFKGLVDSILKDLIRLQIRQAITAPLANFLNSGGGFASIFSGIASFDVGTPRVPRDMIAKVHQDEIIVPAAQSRQIRAGRATLGSAGTSVVNNITVNATGNTAQGASSGADANRIAESVAAQVEAAMSRFIQRQQKVGGLFNAGVNVT